MAERVVKVTLSAQVAEYKRGMLEAANATRTVGTEAEKLAQTRQAMMQVGTTGLALGTLIAAGVGVAIAKFAEFDQAMSAVSATGQDAKANIDALREAAIEAGASTVFSATEAANAIEELAKAGVDAKDILGGGLKGALDLAAAGGLGVAEAAGIAATTMKQFELNGGDATHVADLLAAGAGKAMGDVTDMGQALNQAGLVSNQFGVSVEETVGTLSAFASAGMLGSDAGTSFRTMLLRLANPTGEVKDLMAELGIEAYNSQGQFIGLAGLAGELEDSLGGMTQAQRDQTLAMIFGQDAIRGANILLREGERGIKDWTAAVDDQGFASEMASERLDNLAGDWEQLTGAIDTALITMGAGANGPLRLFVQALTGLVDGFNDLPDWVQQSTLYVAALMSGVLLLGGAFLVGTIKAAEFKVALDQLGISGGKVRTHLGSIGTFLGGPWGIAMLAATAAMLAFNAAIQEGVPAQAEIVNAIKTSKTAADGFRAAFERGGTENFFFGDYADGLKDLPGLLEKATNATANWIDLSFNELGAVDSIKRYGDGLAELAQSDLPAAQDAFAGLRDEYNLTDAQTRQLLETMPAYRDVLLGLAGDQDIAGDSAKFLKLALGELPEETEGAESGIDAVAEAAAQAESDLTDMESALSAVGETALGMGDAVDRAQSAINDLAEAAKVEGAEIAGTNDESIALRDSMRDVEQSHRDAAQAIIENNGTLEEATAKYQQGRQAIIDMMVAKGWDRAEAEAWADTNFGSAQEVQGALAGVKSAVDNIPDKKDVDLNVNTSEASAALEAWRIRWNGMNINFRANVLGLPSSVPVGTGTVLKPDGSANGNLFQYAQAFANGGFPTGIYAGRPESIHKFAEPETGWEAYISGKPDQRTRNIGIWEETGRRLGVEPPGDGGVSLDNARITGTLDLGDGLMGFVDGRISASNSARDRLDNAGKRKRGF